MMLDTGETDCYGEEEPSLYHMLRMDKRRKESTIHQIYTPETKIMTTIKGILHTSYKHYVTKYDTLPTCPDSTDTLLGHIHEKLPEAAKDAFECPITEGEILYAIAQGKEKRVPGPE
jgi:hypothetical protein